MASYQEHLAKQAATRTNNGEFNGPKIHFAGEFLKAEGDTAIVRFPYHSMNDIVYTATHNVVMPGAPYGRRIRCTEDASCELCAQGIKLEDRVFVKFIVYTINDQTNEVELNNTIWDRPSAFADIELKGLFEEYGDISNVLFKVKRSGSGKQTRYTMLPVVNATVYNPAVYRPDFTELNQVDPIKILSKSMEQYKAILNPTATTNSTANTASVNTQVNQTVAPVGNPYVSATTYTAPPTATNATVVNTAPPVYQTVTPPTPVVTTYNTPAATVANTYTAPAETVANPNVTYAGYTAPTEQPTEVRQPRKYQF